VAREACPCVDSSARQPCHCLRRHRFGSNRPPPLSSVIEIAILVQHIPWLTIEAKSSFIPAGSG
jgi:hypothetical protein